MCFFLLWLCFFWRAMLDAITLFSGMACLQSHSKGSEYCALSHDGFGDWGRSTKRFLPGLPFADLRRGTEGCPRECGVGNLALSMFGFFVSSCSWVPVHS